MLKTSEAQARAAASGRSVVIIGTDSLQNKFLADLIEQRVGCICLVRSLDDLNGLPIAARALALLDIEIVAAHELVSHLQSLSASAACRSIAVINADKGMVFDRVIAWPNIMGIFFRDTSQENLLKGVEGILNGGCWLPRRMLSAYLEQSRAGQWPGLPDTGLLTRKEIETLKLLTGGNSNLHIARELNVSPHTVKTHIYNVYRKINVSNRVQAVNWTLQNINGVER